MAREKSAWDRMREKEEERAREEAERLQKNAPGQKPMPGAMKPNPLQRAPTGGMTPDQVTLELVQKADIEIEKITNLYQMFIAGQERMPPVTQRRHLEDIILKIQAGSRAMKSTQFQITQFLAKYSMYKERWDKLVRDIESGKVVVRRRGA